MIRVAIVGATGMVGRMFLKVLEERNLPIDEYVLFASKRSAGQKIHFMRKEYIVQELNENSFDSGFTYALFSAGGDISLKYAPIAASKGCIVIDNSSAWRMDKNVPLIVPEVNSFAINTHKNIISNPNCSTIQAVVALAPLHFKYKIKRIVYSTYQAVSGAGQKGFEDLLEDNYGDKLKKFPYPISYNCIPHIDKFMANGYTKEEMKMILETQKILSDDTIKITATTVRVPVFHSHSESINVEFEKEFELSDVVELLKNSDGIIVQDDILNNVYPMPIKAEGHDEVFIGRIRRDESVENGLNLWVVADNIRKGAATNAVQIMEKLMK
ncbi:MAG: aspartate-semialdehyde dehydrogenase [Clostridiales bacterium]|nr:aspartate-semialdehyde dehydrogenase [Clostridiales bacterium]